MNTYIALFRGINVGGNHILPMKKLKALLTDLGFQNPQTYIQSGNVVFQSTSENLTELSDKISSRIHSDFGFKPRVLLIEPEQFRTAVASNPFPGAEDDPKTLHLYFLSEIPSRPDMETMENIRKQSENIHLDGNIFYLFAPEGIGRSKLAEKAERLLGVPATSRNWRTVNKILEMIG